MTGPFPLLFQCVFYDIVCKYLAFDCSKPSDGKLCANVFLVALDCNNLLLTPGPDGLQ